MDKIDYLLDAVGWLSAAIGQKDENKRVADLAKANRALRQAKETKAEEKYQTIYITPTPASWSFF